jgi:Helix-turn-helix domain
MDRDQLESWLDEGLSLPQIGALLGRPPSTVGYWVERHGLVANGRDRYAPKGALTREQLRPLVDENLTLNEIAARLNRSVWTVRYWLAKLEILRDDVAYRKRKHRLIRAKSIGVRRMQKSCPHHGQMTFRLDSDGGWFCPSCRSEAVANRRRRVKEILVAEAGGQCLICGYDRYVGALQFHHLDPGTKSFNLAQNGVTRALEQARAEARKCVLLCANCHAEVEAGITGVPKSSPGRIRTAMT